MHKTGTTFLQNYFFENRKYLISHNINYPLYKFQNVTFYNNTIPLHILFTDIPSLWLARNAPHVNQDQLKRDIIKYIDNVLINDNSNVLISDEFIYNLSKTQLIKLKKFFEDRSYKIKFSIYIRDPLKHIFSLFQQSSPVSSNTLDIDYLATRFKRKENDFRKIFNLFGKEYIYCYDKAHEKFGLENHFYRFFLGIPSYKKKLKISTTNVSICHESHDLFKYLAKHSKFKHHLNYKNRLENNLDLVDKANNFVIFKRIPGSRFLPSEFEFNKLKPIAENNKKMINGLLGKNFLIENNTSNFTEPCWKLKQLKYIKKVLPLIHTHNIPVVREYFMKTNYKSLKEKNFFEKEIRPFLNIKYRISFILRNFIFKILLKIYHLFRLSWFRKFIS